MDVVYSGEHSINFYTTSLTSTKKRNTWTDFHLIPVVRPYIVYPVPNTKIVPIPGTNKRMDLTDYHVGGLTYGPRAGTWEFYIDHTQVDKWRDIYDAVYKFVHGKELYVTLEDEPVLFYRGMFTMSAYNPGSSYSKLTIQYDLGYDSFLMKEVILGDGSVQLLNQCPIKFIGENGNMWAKDYGFTLGTDYVKKITNKSNEVTVYDLITLDGG